MGGTYERRLDWILVTAGWACGTYASCRRGQPDNAIHDARPNDPQLAVAQLPQLALIAPTAANRRGAMRLTRTLGVPVLQLPSTRPANASWSF